MGALQVLSKVPWRKVGDVCGKVGTVLLIANGVSRAADIDENTQKLVTKLSSVLFKNKVES